VSYFLHMFGGGLGRGWAFAPWRWGRGGGLNLSCAMGWCLVGIWKHLGGFRLSGIRGFYHFLPLAACKRLRRYVGGLGGMKRDQRGGNKRSPPSRGIQVIWVTVCLPYVCRGGNIDYVGDHLACCRHE